jgi:predicted phosphodiesterase
MTEAKNKASRRALAPFALVALVSALASLFALQFVPAAEHPMGPTTLSTQGGFGSGRTTLLVPPLGTVSADTHVAPLSITMTITEVDPNSLADAVADPARRGLLVQEVEGDLRETAVRVGVQLGVGGLVLGALVAALLPRRRWTTVLAGAAGGGIVVGLLLLLTAITYDVQAFQEPRFTGTLERAPQVIGSVSRRVESIDALRSRYEAAADRLSDLLALAAEPQQDPREDSTAILHVSDLHSNPLGLEIVERLVGRFDVDAVLDTGDLTSFGEPIEARMGDAISRLPVPYLFVPGNHDSIANRAALAQVDNIEVVDGEPAQVDDVDILGWADPTFTATDDVTTEEANELREEAAAGVSDEVQRTHPDVLAVHDLRLAEESMGEVPLVVAGHTHERAFEETDGTLTMTVGSTGATGLGSFIFETDLPYEAEIIYFRNGLPVAFDYVSFSGLGGDFEIERRTLDEEPSQTLGRGPHYDAWWRRARAAEGSALLMR